MSAFEIRSVTGSALEELHRCHMVRDFPSNELKPLPMLQSLTAQGINSVWAVEQIGILIAYYVLAHVPSCPAVLLDYFAVIPELRSKGIGSQVLEFVAEGLPAEQYLLIECERPASASDAEERCLRQRRFDFYRRCGAAPSGLCSTLWGVDYALLTMGGRISSLEEDYHCLYRCMLSKDFYQQHVRTYSANETE